MTLISSADCTACNERWIGRDVVGSASSLIAVYNSEQSEALNSTTNTSHARCSVRDINRRSLEYRSQSGATPWSNLLGRYKYTNNGNIY